MKLKTWIKLRLVCFPLLFLSVPSAFAHVGSKDVYETLTAGSYKLYVTVRMPVVIPGVATIEIQSEGPAIHQLLVTPTPITGEAASHPPSADTLRQSSADENFYTGAVWIMASGSWQLRFSIDGAAGPASVAVPIPASALVVGKMQRPLAILLSALGLILVIGIAGIAAAGAREGRLEPGRTAGAANNRSGLVVFSIVLGVALLIVWGGAVWWNVEAASYADDLYHPSTMRLTRDGSVLQLKLGRSQSNGKTWSPIDTSTLLLDHGKIMHLYVIRWPEMDRAYHIHPSVTDAANGGLAEQLPNLDAGDYHLYGDIVHANGFPETLTGTLHLDASLGGTSLSSDDAWASPPTIQSGMLGPVYKLPDGYSMRWDRPASLNANRAYRFTFTLLDLNGEPLQDMQPYLGMAGHAAFVKTDGTVFAHTHPDGSAAMPAMMLANPGAEKDAMTDMPGMNDSDTRLPPTVEFPYGFPSAGRYRIFIQMKHGTTVETGVFDTEVQ